MLSPLNLVPPVGNDPTSLPFQGITNPSQLKRQNLAGNLRLELRLGDSKSPVLTYYTNPQLIIKSFISLRDFRVHSPLHSSNTCRLFSTARKSAVKM